MNNKLNEIEKIEEVLNIVMKVKTNKEEEKIICLTDFIKPHNVDLTYDNNKIVLTIIGEKEEV